MDEFKTDVVVPTYNQFNLVTQCIASLSGQEGIGTIIVVDDASTDFATVEYLSYMHNEGSIRLLRSDSNRGFIRSVNAGMKMVETQYAVIVNSDTVPTGRYALYNLVVGVHNARAQVGGAKLLFMPGSKYGKRFTIQHAGIAFDPELVPYHPFMHLHRDTKAANVTRKVNAVTGAIFCVEVDTWTKVGGFDPVFGGGVYEDVDYCLRAGDVMYISGSEWLHMMHGSQTQGHDLFDLSDHNLEILHKKWRHALKCDQKLFYGV